MTERTVLFVCVENAGRSLMAEAIFNQDPPAGWTAISAGTSPAAAADPRTGRMLAEIGLALPPHPPQMLTGALMGGAGRVVTMGCLDSASCPATLKEIEVADWGLPDPARLDDEGFRSVREELRARIERLRRELISLEPGRARDPSRR